MVRLMRRHQTEPTDDDTLFELLHPWVREWFRTQFGSFSPPQRHAVPNIHDGRNCLISAPTGSGKTLAAFTSIISELTQLAEAGNLANGIYGVYISPLKALGNDIERNLQEPLEGIADVAERDLGIRIGIRTGDTSDRDKQRMRERAPHIFITTPESLAITLTSPQFAQYFQHLRWVVVDEVHALAENKRGVHLSLSLERLVEKISRDVTRIGLSATISPLDEVAKFLVGRRHGAALGELDEADDPWRDCAIVDARFEKPLDLQVRSPVDDFIHTTAQQLNANLYDTLARLIDEHRTTLVFTNTRSATERIVHILKDRYPRFEGKIGAHHGSLSRGHRHEIEQRLKAGDLKAVVTSTSLELGIDVGHIDLVVLVNSPKSVARALQRIGRSGHRLHDTVMGRILVTDRDELVECSVMMKSALEHQLDELHFPTNCLDVLAQQIFGVLMDGRIAAEDLYEIVTRSYPYHALPWADFESVLEYLAGEYASLEDRRVYAKIFYDREKQLIGKRGRLARVLYLTNIGTIPDESYVTVKIGDRAVGSIEESFLEMLRKGDVFVLGGETYQFNYARGMTAQVAPAGGKSPTVPSWFSEMLPLSFGLACDIQRIRTELADRFDQGQTSEAIRAYLRAQLSLDERGVESFYNYVAEQHQYAEIPHRHKILVEYYEEELEPNRYKSPVKTWVIFHSLFGRRVNDALSRAIAWLIARREDKDVEVGITDHGFYVAYEGHVRVMSAFELLRERDLRTALKDALDDSEILRRRFRHCATRSLMILKRYKGRQKSVGRQQVKAMILQSAVEAMDERFPVLREAYREVMEDAMDVTHAEQILDEIRQGQIEIAGRISSHPSPFAFHIVMQGKSDLVKAEDRQAFLQRMYRQMREEMDSDQATRSGT